jgi:3',5'-cyclic AMP phosphodiesterase CpdA
MKKKSIIILVSVFIVASVIGAILYIQRNHPVLLNLRSEETQPEVPVRIGIVTDIGYCSPHGFDSEEHLNLFLADMVNRNVDFQISLGDNAKFRLSNCTKTGDQDNRFIVEKIRSNGVPSYFALGDHDITNSVESYRYWLETARMEKTYTSFDVKDVHIIILDTVLGGDPMSERCEEVTSCIAATEQVRLSRPGSVAYKEAVENLHQEEAKIKNTRSAEIRDRGRLGEEQLRWLEADLKNTDKKKVVLFSDHPLFPFQSDRKSYNTVNADKVRALVKESGKQAVFIGGEAHLAHEEVFEGLQFYIIDLLDRHQGSWAILESDDTGFHVERVNP